MTTSFNFPPACFATAFACDREIETAAKLRSDEIDLLRIVDGEIMLDRLSRAFGSNTVESISAALFAIAGRFPANLTNVSICIIALSNRTEPRSFLPVRGKSMPLIPADASNGCRQIC